jgi:hypothetical protein
MVVTKVDGAALLRETAASASSREESAWSSTNEREAHRDETDHSIPALIAPAAAAKGWARRRRVRIWGTGFASFKNFGEGAWAKSRFLHKIGLGASYGFRAEWCRPIPVLNLRTKLSAYSLQKRKYTNYRPRKHIDVETSDVYARRT